MNAGRDASSALNLRIVVSELTSWRESEGMGAWSKTLPSFRNCAGWSNAEQLPHHQLGLRLGAHRELRTPRDRRGACASDGAARLLVQSHTSAHTAQGGKKHAQLGRGAGEGRDDWTVEEGMPVQFLELGSGTWPLSARIAAASGSRGGHVNHAFRST